MQADHGVSVWINPEYITEMSPASYGNTQVFLKTGKSHVVREKPQQILELITKAREDEQGEMEV